MSTKIYNAYRVCDNKIETVFNIKKKLESLYAKLVYSQLDQFGRKTLEGIEGYYKKGYVFWDIINRYILWDGKEYQERNNVLKKTPLKSMHYSDLIYVLEGFTKQGENDPLNFDASMVLYEYEGNMYVQFFGLSGYKYLNDIFGEYFEELFKKGILTDWHYQNQTDDDEAIDSSDWNKRKTMWDELYKDYDYPAQIGFSYDFFSKMLRILYYYKPNKEGEPENATG
jgi:hypothetical protein